MNFIIDMASVPEKQKLFGILKKLKPVRYVFDVKQWKNRRSINQNRYYFGVVLETISQATGFFPDELHDILKRKFNPKIKVLRQTGEELLIGGTTTELNTEEFEKYLENIRIWALSELDVLVPLPGEI